MAVKVPREWSLTGGARAAREARIATVRHLREAPIARVWQMGKLLSAFQLQAASVGHPGAATGLLFGGLGYRPPYPADWQAAAELVLADEARYLAEADLYILTPQMCDVVIAAAQTLTRNDLELASDDDLPGMTGLVVLPHPVIVQTMSGDLADDRAYTWRYPACIPQPARRGVKEIPAVRMSAYHDASGPVRPDTFLDFAAQARAQGTPLPPLLLDSIRCQPLRYAATPEQLQALQDYMAKVRQAGDLTREQLAAHGLEENRVIGEYTPGDQIEDRDDTFMPRFLYALWRLCQQQIAAVDTAAVTHSAQVIADRAGVSPDVRVVRLRRTTSSGDDAHLSRDWHHRWVVRMHKVRQWYPSLQQHKVLYRGPYIKGPSDKPLLHGETVWALVR